MNIIYISLIVVSFFVLTSLLRHKRRRDKVVNVVESNCAGCKACIRRCRYKVLEMVANENGEQAAFVKNPASCTACGDCIKQCKFNALELHTRTQESRNKL
ncbi:MAG: 4Fe-4S binding protein [Bacteroidales bacterium]|jgi:NAD-dependent dihydropyrimidine dehydrogenase PreA subunit|nr:4Fe-4S binding protein [Bacteroidales bacterium]